MSFKFGLFLCKHYQVASASTKYEYDLHIVEQRIQLLQGATPGFNDGETQVQRWIVFYDQTYEVQNKGYDYGDLARIVESNPFSSMHVHHNGNHEGGAHLDYRGKT